MDDYGGRKVLTCHRRKNHRRRSKVDQAIYQSLNYSPSDTPADNANERKDTKNKSPYRIFRQGRNIVHDFRLVVHVTPPIQI